MTERYESVTAYPDGSSTVSRYAKTAASYGYDGLVVRTREADYDPNAISEAYGVDIVSGIEVIAETPDSIAGSVGNFREACTLLLVAAERTPGTGMRSKPPRRRAYPADGR